MLEKKAFQLPTITQNGQTAVALPLMDLNNQYCLLTTSLTGLLNGSDFPYPFANFRNYMSASDQIRARLI